MGQVTLREAAITPTVDEAAAQLPGRPGRTSSMGSDMGTATDRADRALVVAGAGGAVARAEDLEGVDDCFCLASIASSSAAPGVAPS